MRTGVVFGAVLGVAGVLGLAVVPGGARGEVPVEAVGEVVTLPPLGPHLVWVGDALMERSALIDVDDGRMLGVLSSGWGIPIVLAARDGSEVYTVETHYSRRSRGERTDVLTVHDTRSLAPVAEVVLPPKRAISAVPVAHAAVSDDGGLAAIFNLDPSTSVSVVDLEARRLAGEVATPGCSLVYPVGPRRFAMLCMDGALLVLEFDAEGGLVRRERSEPFFDPDADPVIEKAARWGDRWLFASFQGVVHPVDFSGETPRFEPTWTLASASERADGWRIGGSQLLAAHEDSGRLYALMHQGGPDSHKDVGSEVWVYDLGRGERVQRIELRNPGFTYLGVPIRAEGVAGWVLDKLGDWAMGAVPELGVDTIVVTQDAEPRLVTSGSFSGGLAVYDGLTGEFLGRGFSGNLTNLGIVLAKPGPR